MPLPPPPQAIEALRHIVGAAGVLGAEAIATRPAGVSRTDTLQAQMLVRPQSTDEVAQVLRWCHGHGAAVVTQGGLSGLVHGADASPSELILSLERMRRIEDIDAVQRTATVQAGVTLQALQEAADAAGLLFPLDLGARGSATLGGNAATNAGGNRVIRYGMTREMVLGLEVVLADGTVLPMMNRLLKNNAGYDLKQLFIGSEGTLGVITRLVLRLREKPRSHDVALLALPSFAALVAVLQQMGRMLGGALSAFEAMWPAFYRLVTTPPALGRAPLPHGHAFYALVECLGGDPAADGERFAAALAAAHEQGLLADAVVAQSDAERAALWALRDDVAQVRAGGTPVVFDVSLPVAAMEGYVDRLAAQLSAGIGEHRLWVFGHLGDGNLHVIVQVRAEDAPALRPRIEALVYAPLADIGGSVSAEHGIGIEKKPWLQVSRSAAEIALMHTLKAALDPRGILNPGKVI